MSARSAPAFALALLGLAACSFERVDREQEMTRFNATIEQRTARFGFAPDRVLSLPECEAIALENNLDYRTRLLQAQLRDEQVREAMAALLPQARAEFRDTSRSNEPAFATASGPAALEDRQIERFRITTVIPIFDFGATLFAYQIAEDERKQERLAAVRARQTLIRDVRVAYARIAGTMREESLLEAEVDANREDLRAARALEREGLAAVADTAFVEANLARADLDYTVAKRDVMLARSVLSRLMSVPTVTEYTIDPELQVEPVLPESLEDVRRYEQAALRRRPETWSQDLERDIAAARVRQEFARFFPRLDGILDFEWSSNSVLVNPAFVNAGYSVAHTLLDGTATLWRHRGAKIQEGVEAERAILVAMGIVFEIDFRLLELVRASDGFEAREKLVAAQERLLEQARSRHREGLQSGADLARALADFHTARRGLERTRTEYLIAWFDLQGAMAADALDAPLDEAERIPIPAAEGAAPAR